MIKRIVVYLETTSSQRATLQGYEEWDVIGFSVFYDPFSNRQYEAYLLEREEHGEAINAFKLEEVSVIGGWGRG